MRKLFLFIVIVLFSTPTFAGEHVRGYYKNNGTYVQPHYRSSPNNTVTDNYSYKGNVNPYKGSVGTNRYQHDTTSPYYDGTPDSNGHTDHNNSLFDE
jgi:hypothetical protein